LLGFENDDHQDDEHDNEKPSPEIDEGHPEEGDHTDSNHSKDVLQRHHDAHAPAASGLSFIRQEDR
jgi:hypothetical protein